MKTTTKHVFKALAMVYIVFIGALIWNVIQYLFYRADVINRYTTLGFPDPDYHPFLTWSNNSWLVSAGVGLLFITLVIICAHMSKRKAALSMTIMVILAISSFAIIPITTSFGAVAQDKPLFVNTLVYFDEEMAGDESARFSVVGNLFIPVRMAQNPAWKFKEQVGVEFRWLNGFDFYNPDDPDYRTRYEYWDSKDSEHCCYYMLQEAIEEKGGIHDPVENWWVISENMMYQINETHTEIVDLVFFCTGQEMDTRGLSPPQWRATIIQYGLTPPLMMALMVHELSHQFNIGHCPGICVMNPDLGYYVGTWCTGCYNDLVDNKRYRFGYKSWVCIEGDNPSHGYTNPTAGTYHLSESSTFTITAYADEGYYISTWTVSGSPPRTICGNQNPLHYEVDSNAVIITPNFSEKQRSSCEHSRNLRLLLR